HAWRDSEVGATAGLRDLHSNCGGRHARHVPLVPPRGLPDPAGTRPHVPETIVPDLSRTCGVGFRTFRHSPYGETGSWFPADSADKYPIVSHRRGDTASRFR